MRSRHLPWGGVGLVGAAGCSVARGCCRCRSARVQIAAADRSIETERCSRR